MVLLCLAAVAAAAAHMCGRGSGSNDSGGESNSVVPEGKLQQWTWW